MPRKKLDLATIRKIGLALPGVEASTAYGAFALKFEGKLIACVPTNKSAEPGSLMVRVDFERRGELLEGAPQTYYLKDHYKNYPSVLVRLSEIDADTLRDLLRSACRFVRESAKTRPKGRRAR